MASLERGPQTLTKVRVARNNSKAVLQSLRLFFPLWNWRGTGAKLWVSPALGPDVTEEIAPYRKPSTNTDFFSKYGPAVRVPQIQWG